MRSLYNLTAILTSTLNYERVLDTALDVSANALSPPAGGDIPLVSAVMLFEGEILQIHSARRFTPADTRKTFPGLKGLLGEVIAEGKARLGENPSHDPELSHIVAMHACRSVYCIPLRSGLDVYGVLLFAHPEADFFSEETREVLDIIASQAMVALQNARLYHELEQEKERLIETEEEARKKLARDLHDGPTQSLAAIAMRVNFIRRLVERSPKEAADELFKVEELARRTTKEIRHMLFTLRPLVLESQGLRAALQTMAEKTNETFEQNVTVEVDDELAEQLDLARKGVIFQIVEEAVNNARKHAKADHIWVRLKPAGQGLALLEIEDDGVGFDVGAVQTSYENRGSLGLVNLREQAELMNGVFQLESKPGHGTRIQIWIPLTEEATGRLRQQV